MKYQQSEKDIQTQILDYLVLKNIFHWRSNTGVAKYTDSRGKERFVKFGEKGISDILGIFKGIFFAIEVKKLKNKPTKHQANFLQNVKDNGGIAIVARSVDDVFILFKSN